MAAIAPLPQVAQAAAAPAQPSNAISPPQNDPLFDALVKYVTTGYGAEHVAASELQQIMQQTISQPGGRQYLETLTTPSTIDDMRIWNYSSPVSSGHFRTTASTFALQFVVEKTGSDFRGQGKGVFFPSFTTLDKGTIFYDDPNVVTFSKVTFTMRLLREYNVLLVDFFNLEGAKVASASFSDVSMLFPPSLNGTGDFAQVRTQ